MDEANPAGPPVLGYAVAIIAALLSAGVYYGLAFALKGQAVPLLVAGPIVGLGVRLAAKQRPNALAITSVVCAISGASIGFILADGMFWQPYILGEAIRRLFGLQGIILLAATGYIAYLIASPTRLPARHP